MLQSKSISIRMAILKPAMETASVKQIKTALTELEEKELIDIINRLATFKKENKELLSYLLFEKDYESGYIESVSNMIDREFEEMNARNYYYIKKSVRKILRTTKKYIRYSKETETEIALLIHFCKTLKSMSPTYRGSIGLVKLYNRTIEQTRKKLTKLHEDLQYDYQLELDEL